MISREDALSTLDKFTYVIDADLLCDSELSQNLIKDIYDSIGSCEKCKFYSPPQSYTHKGEPQRPVACGKYIISVTPAWFCADFKLKENNDPT